MNRRNLLQALFATLASLPIAAGAARRLGSGEPLRAGIQQVGSCENPRRQMEGDVFSAWGDA